MFYWGIYASLSLNELKIEHSQGRAPMVVAIGVPILNVADGSQYYPYNLPKTVKCSWMYD